MHFTQWKIPGKVIRGEVWDSDRAHYFLRSNQWAGILSTPKFDRFTGEPIGSIITEQHAKQVIMQGKSVDEFLKELPAVPTAELKELCRILAAQRTERAA